MSPRLLSLALSAAVLACAADETPTAAAVIDRYVDATGGRAAYEAVRSQMFRGTVEFAGKGLKGAITSYRSAPANVYSAIELPGIGKIEEGSNGDVVWELSAIQGARIKDGAERAMGLRAGEFNSDLRWRELYPKTALEGLDEVDGRPAWRVVLTPRDGPAQTRYYDKENGLLLRMKTIVRHPMGEIPTQTDFADYKEVAGLKSPHTMRQKVAGNELVIRIEEIVYNADAPAGRFDVPAEVQKLSAKQKK